jgi:hypothetical protein
MEYNTEKINEIAQSVAKLVEESIKAKTEHGANPIAEIEKEFREILRQIGQKALGLYLNGLQKTPESEIPCSCGGQLHYQRLREAKLISVFGKVSYRRAYYAGCQCQKGKAPLDEKYGLEPGSFTAGLAQLMALAGIAFSFEESEKWLSEFLLFEISENSIRTETEGLGLIQKQADEIAVENSQNEKALQERLRVPKNIPIRLYGSIDAAKVRIEPRTKREEVVPEHENWRDMKVGCWYQAEPVSKIYQSKRQKAKAERDGTVFRTTNHHYYCDISPADQFGKLVWASGCNRSADLVPELVFVCDGAIWIWDLISHYYQNAKQIVDWYHAEDHLKKFAEAVFDSPDKRQAWLDQVTEMLWQGQVEEVVLECKSLEALHPRVQPTALYFANNSERMRYDQFRAQGYLIGSGTIESGCKQIVTQRLKRSGAQWTLDGAVQTAKARAVWLSGDWDSLSKMRSALPLAA